jgi:arylsulfatase A-like enzyme
MSKKKNLIIFGIDSLRRDHMSLYGYDRLTTPHIDKYAKGGVTFNNPFSPSIPTTPGYASMLTGLDSFGTNTVALRHKGEGVVKRDSAFGIFINMGSRQTVIAVQAHMISS